MEEMIGVVKLFSGNFAPRGWEFCQGQIIEINNNQALFSIIGILYGGDGRTTFALPNLTGRVPIHHDSEKPIGATMGAETVQLAEAELPKHSHSVGCNNLSGDSDEPKNCYIANEGHKDFKLYSSSCNSEMQKTFSTGNNQPHNNMQPSLSMSYIICLEGVYPPRD